jgi:hypothetical protein
VIELRVDEALAVSGSPRQAIRAAVDLQQRFVEETLADPPRSRSWWASDWTPGTPCRSKRGTGAARSTSRPACVASPVRGRCWRARRSSTWPEPSTASGTSKEERFA